MGNLPETRLASFTSPFSYVGMDYCGPFEIKVGRSVLKRWCALFTCLTTRAIHLEVAQSMNTSSCFMCIKNFRSRRGSPIEITCDNGTNFRGATNELARELKRIDSNRLQNEFADIKWTFIPPRAPHMGGAWERMNRIVKSNLMEVIPTLRKPDDEVFLSALVEIEGIINSRPLTEIPIGEGEPALTPNHFLLGTSGGLKPFGEFNDEKAVLRKNWQTSEQIANHYWRRWVVEYLPNLTRRTKWFD